MGEGGKGGRLRRGKRIVCYLGEGAGKMCECIREGRRGYGSVCVLVCRGVGGISKLKTLREL